MKMKIAEAMWTELVRELHARDDVETAAIVLARFHNADESGVLVVKEVLSVPPQAYLARYADRLSIDPVAINRLARRARDQGLSIFTAHSHPRSERAFFSWADDDGDAQYLPSLRNWIDGVPHGSIVVASSGEVAARALTSQGMIPVTIHVVGRQIRSSAVPFEYDERFARQFLALGADGQAALRRLRVGVIGLGGIGSMVAVQLAHLGVGEAVFADGDLVEMSNLSRIVGARQSDIGSPKIEVAARYVREAALPMKVHTSNQMLSSIRDAESLAACDAIISCVDCVSPRAVLNRFAYESLVPVIDLGTGFRVDKSGKMCGQAGRVVVVGPGRPCLACWGHLDPDALRNEAIPPHERQLLEKEGYVEGAAVEQPSVIAFNTMVAGAGVVELLRMFTGFAADEPPDRLAFSFASATVRRNTLRRDPECLICGSSAQK